MSPLLKLMSCMGGRNLTLTFFSAPGCSELGRSMQSRSQYLEGTCHPQEDEAQLCRSYFSQSSVHRLSVLGFPMHSGTHFDTQPLTQREGGGPSIFSENLVCPEVYQSGHKGKRGKRGKEGEGAMKGWGVGWGGRQGKLLVTENLLRLP